MRKKIENLCEFLLCHLSDYEIDILIELTYSETAVKHNVNNDFPLSLFNNALITANIAEYFLRRGYKINSGYRSAEVNKLVGGKENSRHLVFRALDIQLNKWDTSLVVENIIRELEEYLSSVAYIDYYYRKGNMLHIQWSYV